jgi:ABC-2 type transport system permease protein
MRFMALLQYRVAALAGLGTQLFWGIIRVMIFTAFFASSTAAQPMTLPQTITYVWLGQAMLMLVLFRADPDLMEMMRTGNVAYELLKPVGLYKIWFSREVANRIAPTLLRAGPLILLALLFFGMELPASAASLLVALVSLAAAVLLSASVTTLSTVLLLFTIAGRGTYYLTTAAIWIFSGLVLPMKFFPDWAQPVLEFLPFRGLMDTPFRLYMGHIPPAEALPVIAHQLVWTAAIVLLGRTVLASARRRIVVQGG